MPRAMTNAATATDCAIINATPIPIPHPIVAQNPQGSGGADTTTDGSSAEGAEKSAGGSEFIQSQPREYSHRKQIETSNGDPFADKRLKVCSVSRRTHKSSFAFGDRCSFRRAP